MLRARSGWLTGGLAATGLLWALLGSVATAAEVAAVPSAAAALPAAVALPAEAPPSAAVPAPAVQAPQAPAAVAVPKRPSQRAVMEQMLLDDQREPPPGASTMQVPAGSAEDLALGRSIYLQGLGRQGRPLVGVRFGGIETSGPSVACVSCHRRSGLGSVEGTDQVSPVAGRFLFSDDPAAVSNMNFRTVKSFNKRHPPYSMETFAKVLREGIHVTGRELSPIMPRYPLDADELRGLATYLRSLSEEWSPGVTRRRIRFATVITPEVDAVRRKVFIDTMRATIAQNNGSVTPRQRTMNAAEMYLDSQRWWDLEVWELQGAADTWASQLEARYRQNPVFALVSGLGDSTWAPVHEFCERQAVPCWFPSVDLPPDAAHDDFYSVYFSRGVKLEAEVLAKHLLAAKPRPTRVVQLLADDAVARGGAQALSAALRGAKPAIKVVERVLPGFDAANLQRALAKLGKRDVAMVWARPGETPALATLAPKGEVYFSAHLLNGDALAVPESWRKQARVIYPFQLPERRATGLVYFNSWLKIRKLPLADELMQSEVYFTMSYLKETLMDMLHNLHRDYLLERAESMLSLRESSKAEDEARDMMVAKHQVEGGTKAALQRRVNVIDRNVTPRPMPGHAPHAMAKRESTTVYPRLGLAQHQRFASKGAYIVGFDPEQAGKLVAQGEWIIP